MSFTLKLYMKVFIRAVKVYLHITFGPTTFNDASSYDKLIACDLQCSAIIICWSHRR